MWLEYEDKSRIFSTNKQNAPPSKPPCRFREVGATFQALGTCSVGDLDREASTAIKPGGSRTVLRGVDEIAGAAVVFAVADEDQDIMGLELEIGAW